MKRASGLSLLEVIIVVFLFFAATAMVAALFKFGATASVQAEERHVLQNDRLKIVSRLRAALSNSYRSGNSAFYLNTSGPKDDLVLSVIQPGSWNEEEQRIYFSGHIVYYREPTSSTLRILEIPGTPTDEALSLSEAQIRAALATDPGVVVLEECSAFQLIHSVNGSTLNQIPNPVHLRLNLQTQRDTILETEFGVKVAIP